MDIGELIIISERLDKEDNDNEEENLETRFDAAICSNLFIGQGVSYLNIIKKTLLESNVEKNFLSQKLIKLKGWKTKNNFQKNYFNLKIPKF